MIRAREDAYIAITELSYIYKQLVFGFKKKFVYVHLLSKGIKLKPKFNFNLKEPNSNIII